MKVGDVFTSSQGTNLRLTITEVKKTQLSFRVQRKVVDRKTGEIVIEERERTVTTEMWPHVLAGYVPTRKT